MGRGGRKGKREASPERTSSQSTGETTKGRKRKEELSRKKLFSEMANYLAPLDKKYKKELLKTWAREAESGDDPFVTRKDIEKGRVRDAEVFGLPDAFGFDGDIPTGFVQIARSENGWDGSQYDLQLEPREDRLSILKKEERKEVEEYLDVINEKLDKRAKKLEKEAEKKDLKRREKGIKKREEEEKRKERVAEFEAKEKRRREKRREREAAARQSKEEDFQEKVNDLIERNRGISGAINEISERSRENLRGATGELQQGDLYGSVQEMKDYHYADAALARECRPKYEAEVEAIAAVNEIASRTNNPLLRLRAKRLLEEMEDRRKFYREQMYHYNR